jgi:hypothetical protein
MKFSSKNGEQLPEADLFYREKRFEVERVKGLVMFNSLVNGKIEIYIVLHRMKFIQTQKTQKTQKNC